MKEAGLRACFETIAQYLRCSWDLGYADSNPPLLTLVHNAPQ